MIVVVPVCQKDVHLAKINLEWVKQLDGTVPYRAVLSHDRSLDAGDLLEGLRGYFTGGVDEFIYDKWTGSSAHPQPENHAWQKTARHMSELGDCWFWWEQDGVPIKKGWLQSLESAYQTASSPFMGYRANGYTCGLMVYPAKVGEHCISALLAIHHSWDTVIADRAMHRMAVTSLIQHRPHSRDLHFEGCVDLGCIEPETVIFHRCKDGSLVECLSRITINEMGTQEIKVEPMADHPIPKKAVGELVIIAYLPPPGVCNTEVFLRNLKDYPPHNRIIFLSDYSWPNVTRISDPVGLVGRNYKKIFNHLLMESLRLAKKEGFKYLFYLESDCRVKGDDWDERLFSEFKSYDHAIIGGCLNICAPELSGPASNAQFIKLRTKFNKLMPDGSRRKWPVIEQGPHRSKQTVVLVNGSPAIYNVAEVLAILDEEKARNNLSQVDVLDGDLGWMISRKYGVLESFKKVVQLPSVIATGGETIVPLSDRMAELTDERVCAIHPIKSAWRPTRRVPRFYFSGDLGDIIYSLKAIKTFGVGELLLGPQNKTSCPPREPINPKLFEFLSSLLRTQSYIKNINFCPTHPNDDDIDYDFNFFREAWNSAKFRADTGINRLFEMMAERIGVRGIINEDPWLEGVVPEQVMPIVINRSYRYKQDDMPWQAIMDRFRNQSLFVGLPQEHAHFSSEHGHLCYYPIKDAMEMAGVIAGAKWFIGNQSFPCSLALGLGSNVYQETWLKSPDCVFHRGNFHTWKESIDIITI